MARVAIELEKIGNMWRGEVVGPRGARRRDRASDWLPSIDLMLDWVAKSVPEVDPPPASAEAVKPEPPPVEAAPVLDERSLVLEPAEDARPRRGVR
jgi:hypothetical protein